ncbi:MAG: twin transmembrane helix small protein [Brevundimonas sp.]|uniref:twin transmembrane helix small protein n=1 Tax=Brevundimonas sp. TaxID=1871086 RepID=UPI0040335289
MENLFNVLILAAIGAVAVTLGFGIYSLYRGGDYARSNSNKLMRLRVALQALAIALLVAGMWWKSTHPG